jgi:hypothetical protein
MSQARLVVGVPVRANLRIHVYAQRQWFCCEGMMDIKWTKSQVTIPTGVRCARMIGRTTKKFLHNITNPNMEWFKLEIATFKFAEQMSLV